MVTDPQHEVIADARFELRVRQLAPPLTLLLLYAALSLPTLAGALRIFLSMWLHELGHTVSAWLCGFAALPGPWRTRVPEARSWWVLGLVLLGLGWSAWRVWASGLDERPRQLALAAVAAAAALVVWLWTWPEERASQLILFAGDGGGMVLGVALIACFFVGQEHRFHHTGLRWGFLVIGAAAYLDPARVWLRASDPDTIAFGHIEGVGDSDPSRLVDGHDWSVDALVGRYQTLLWACAAAIVLLYVRGVLAARKQVEREREADAARATATAGASARARSTRPPMAGSGTSRG
jgi:hypothetical protein